jgi:kinesin family protein 11
MTGIAPGGAALGMTSAAGAVTAASETMGERLKIVQDDKLGLRVSGLEEISVKTPRECFEYLRKGIAKRATAETKCNAASSRSHCVFTLIITVKEVFDGQDMLRVGKLNLVDLAGSECVGRSGATDKRAREAGNINQSLLTLGRVITSLVDKLPHVPYRDSKLTRLLQDSLGGRTKTCMIATVSPALVQAEESCSTLEYAARAKKIQNRPEACARVERREVVAGLAKDLERLRERLRAQIESQEGFIKVLESEYTALLKAQENGEAVAAEVAAERERLMAEAEAAREVLDSTRAALEEARAMHAATCARLAQTEERLATTLTELVVAQKAHEDARAVVRGRIGVEAALTEQATGVLTVLRGAAGDAAGLHAKVARVSRTMTDNGAAASAFGAATATRLDALMSESADVASAVTAAVNSLSSEAAAFQVAAAEEGATILAALAELKGEAGSYAKAVGASAGALDEEAGRMADVGTEGVESARANVKAGVEEGGKAIGQALSTIAATLEAQALKTAAWQARSTAALAALASSMAAFGTQHTATLAGIAAEVEAHAESVDAALVKQAAAVDAASAAANAATQAAADGLMARIAADMAALVASAAAMRTSHAAEQQAAVSAVRTSVGVLRSEAVAALGEAKSGTTAFVGEAATSVAAEMTAVTTAQAGAVAIVAAGREGVTMGRAAVVSNTGVVMVAADGASAAAINALAGVQSAVAAHVSRTRSGAVAAAEASGRAADAVAASMADASAHAIAFAEGATGVASKVAASSAASATAVYTWAVEEGRATHSFLSTGLATEPLTGATPAKREYPAPADWVAASPPANVAKRFRVAKDEGADTPAADAAAWGDKLASLPPLAPVVAVPAAAGESKRPCTGSAAPALLFLLGRKRSTSSADAAVASVEVVDVPSAATQPDVSMAIAPLPLPSSPPAAPPAAQLEAVDAAAEEVGAAKRTARAPVVPAAAPPAPLASRIAIVASNPPTVVAAAAAAQPAARRAASGAADGKPRATSRGAPTGAAKKGSAPKRALAETTNL